MTYFKVMTPRDGKLWSSCKSGESPFAIEYPLDKVVLAPEGTRLFVFGSLRAAVDFAGCGQHIYECEATDAKRIRDIVDIRNASLYWKWLLQYGISEVTTNYIYFKNGSSLGINISFNEAFTVSALKLTNKAR